MGINDGRKIMERHLRRPLLLNEVVHHINGNHNDNRIKNLMLTNEPYHSRLHGIKRQGKWYKENLVGQVLCPYCQKHLEELPVEIRLAHKKDCEKYSMKIGTKMLHWKDVM